jgi:hypothetical protein
MYSLTLIIFVVSEMKAFEHFSIGSNVNLCPAMAAILDFRDDHWKVLYKVEVFYVDRKSKMAATTGHRLTLDPMGKCSNAFFSEPTNIIKHSETLAMHSQCLRFIRVWFVTFMFDQDKKSCSVTSVTDGRCQMVPKPCTTSILRLGSKTVERG